MDESCADPVSILIRGNAFLNDLLEQGAIVVPAGKSLSYEVCIRSQEILLPGSMLVGRLSAAPQNSGICEGTCEEVFRLPACCHPAVDSFRVFSGGFTPTLAGADRYFTLHIENDLDSHDPATRSGVLVDNLCLEVEDNITSTDDVFSKGAICRIFPNPTSGGLMLSFTDATPRLAVVQLLDVYGRKLMAAALNTGISSHQLSLENVPAGMYFVQVLRDGVPVWSEKVVKQ